MGKTIKRKKITGEHPCRMPKCDFNKVAKHTKVEITLWHECFLNLVPSTSFRYKRRANFF